MPDERLLPTRSQRLWKQRKRQRQVAVSAGTLSLAIVISLVVTAESDDRNSGPNAPFTFVTQESPAAPHSSPVLGDLASKLAELRDARPLSHEDPLRLWVGGDSLAGGIGPAIGQYAEDSGVVRALVDFKVSSGLASSVRDWPEYAADLIEESDPEATIFMIGANDANIVTQRRGDWEPDYRAKVQEMMDLLSGDADRTVFWIGAPPMRLAERERGVLEVNRVFLEEALTRPNVIYVDAYAILEGPEGGYSSAIEIPGDGRVYVRSGDGVHLSSAGADWLGYNIWRLVDRRWGVGNFAEPDLPIDYETEPGGNTGCCEESTTTTPPATASSSTTMIEECPTDDSCPTTSLEGETATTALPSESTSTSTSATTTSP